MWALATGRDGSAIMWFGVVTSTICSIVFATNLIPGSSSLTLDKGGFEMKQFYYVRRTRWQTVTNINAGNISSSSVKTVQYNDSAFRGWKLAKLETAALGYNAMLPDTYSMTADDLAALMTQWWDRLWRRRLLINWSLCDTRHVYCRRGAVPLRCKFNKGNWIAPI